MVVLRLKGGMAGKGTSRDQACVALLAPTWRLSGSPVPSVSPDEAAAGHQALPFAQVIGLFLACRWLIRRRAHKPCARRAPL